MEQDLRRIEPGEFATDADGNEVRGRIDIRYASSGGRHVIVELKRYGRTVTADELARQGKKYANALRQLLEAAGRDHEKVEVVFVLGSKPRVERLLGVGDDDQIDNQLRIFGGSYILYDSLITHAKNQYSEYLEASDKAKDLDLLLGSLDDDNLDAP